MSAFLYMLLIVITMITTILLNIITLLFVCFRLCGGCAVFNTYMQSEPLCEGQVREFKKKLSNPHPLLVLMVCVHLQIKCTTFKLYQ